jgi:ubiquinone/menaquinone biosynthesis C-methylase UbiE
MNNYNRIAAVYDSLSRMIFFKSQIKAQSDQLKYITPKSKILIVGGGTGWVLEELSKLYSSELYITYVEVSTKMIRLAKKRDVKKNKVTFIPLAIEKFESLDQFDVIQSAFLFDNFSDERASQVFDQLEKYLKPGGLWLFCDFQYEKQQGKTWKWLMLKTMYLFFRLVSNVEAKELVNMDPFFEKRYFTKIFFKSYYNGFIKSVVYKKPIPDDDILEKF